LSARTFISHASEDAPLAQALCAGLEARGRSCWIAPRDVAGGMPYAREIAQALRRAPALVLVLSSASSRSEYVLREVDLAASLRVPIVTLRVEEIRPGDDLAFYIGSEHWVDGLCPPVESHLAAVETALANAERRRGAATAGPAGASWAPPRERVLTELSADLARYQDVTFKLKATLEESTEVLVRDAAANKTLLAATLAYNAFAPGLIERLPQYRASIRKYWGGPHVDTFDALHRLLEAGIYRGALFGLNPIRARLNGLATGSGVDGTECRQLDADKAEPLRALQARLDELATASSALLGALERSA
jgi:hypothetical protein